MPYLATGSADAATRAASAARALHPPFVLPITATIGQGWYGNRGGKLHQGLDFPAKIGTPVRAAGSGKIVVSSGWGDGTGEWIVVEHDGDLAGFRTRYLHLSRRLVKKGDTVEAGQVIALSGNTGRSTGPHLHFDLQADPKARKDLLAALKPGGLVGRPFRGANMVPAEILLPVPRGDRPPLAGLGYTDVPYEPEDQPPAGGHVPPLFGAALLGMTAFFLWRAIGGSR